MTQQYQDTGLVVKVKPVISNDGYVQLKLELTSNNFEASASPNNLTPTFTQRTFTTTARIANGQAAIVAGVRQQSEAATRTGLPLIAFIPLLGRMFSSPTQQGYANDIVVTVTPHIVRSPAVNLADHRAIPVGTQSNSQAMTIEQVIKRLNGREP